MAKKPKGRRQQIRKANLDDELALSTLASNTLLGGDLVDVMTEKGFILSTEAVYSLQNVTPGEGPISIGWSHSDFTDAEVEAYLEATAGFTSSDKIAQEIQSRGRYIKTVGKFNCAVTDETLNDGMPVKTAIKIALETGQTLKFWAYNHHSSALTTGAKINSFGHIWWKQS